MGRSLPRLLARILAAMRREDAEHWRLALALSLTLSLALTLTLILTLTLTQATRAQAARGALC